MGPNGTPNLPLTALPSTRTPPSSDGYNHSLWIAAPTIPSPAPLSAPPSTSRLDIPLIRTARYFKKKYFYPLNVFCGCGYEVRAIPYIIYDCILFLEVRNSVGIDNRRVTTLPTLLGAVNRAKSLLRFLDNGP